MYLILLSENKRTVHLVIQDLFYLLNNKKIFIFTIYNYRFLH